MRREILRLIDANFNRSREGLRVCEDIARFILDSEAMTRKLKKVRHDLTRIMKCSRIPAKKLPLSRNIANDIGKSSGLLSEMSRSDTRDIFLANIERVKESMRVLEEFFKLCDREAAAEASSLRFMVYDIEKSFAKRISSLRGIK